MKQTKAVGNVSSYNFFLFWWYLKMMKEKNIHFMLVVKSVKIKFFLGHNYFIFQRRELRRENTKIEKSKSWKIQKYREIVK